VLSFLTEYAFWNKWSVFCQTEQPPGITWSPSPNFVFQYSRLWKKSKCSSSTSRMSLSPRHPSSPKWTRTYVHVKIGSKWSSIYIYLKNTLQIIENKCHAQNWHHSGNVFHDFHSISRKCRKHLQHCRLFSYFDSSVLGKWVKDTSNNRGWKLSEGLKGLTVQDDEGHDLRRQEEWKEKGTAAAPARRAALGISSYQAWSAVRRRHRDDVAHSWYWPSRLARAGAGTVFMVTDPWRRGLHLPPPLAPSSGNSRGSPATGMRTSGGEQQGHTAGAS
jgi:hypothetical protein